MKVSVVIPAYNEEKYISFLLKSLQNQQEKADEIILVDNNCNDKTIEIAKKFPVKIVREKKQGMIFARNSGFNQASYEIIARCDADTIVPKDWVKRIKDNFSSGKIDCLTGPIVFYDLFLKTDLPAKIYRLVLKLFLKGNEVLIGPNMALTKKIWKKVAKSVCLNDKLVHEDIDLSLHILKAGGKIYFDNHLVVKASGRRIKTNPLSFFIEYPIRLIKTLNRH